MAARDALDDLRTVHKVLQRLKISHALIGGWATIAWGSVRVTRDLDLLVLVDAPSRQRLQLAFERLDYHVKRCQGGIDDPIPELLRLTPKQIGERLTIDFLSASKGYDRDALARAVSLRLGGSMIPVVCREDLIAMKLSAGGGVDLQDAKALLELHSKKLNRPLLDDSCRRLKVGNLLQRILEKGW